MSERSKMAETEAETEAETRSERDEASESWETDGARSREVETKAETDRRGDRQSRNQEHSRAICAGLWSNAEFMQACEH